jgi:Lanthionine synthetase C-like protein
VARRCPLLDQAVDDASLADYAAWARALHDDVTRTIAAIHERGLVYGDLHLFNVIIRPSGRIALIDFEAADEIGSDRRPVLGAGGFAAADRRGAGIDHHALACLKLALFLPLVQLVGIDRGKAVELADVIAGSFPVERDWLDEAVAVIAPDAAAAPTGSPSTSPSTAPSSGPEDRLRIEADAAAWPDLRDALAGGILASATPDRDDRLYPGDIAQFDTGGLNLAHGAAGVLLTLARTGHGCPSGHVEWLLDRVRPDVVRRDTTRLGFYDGLHGVAYTLAELGHRDEAVELVGRCLDEPWEQVGSTDVAAGLAGMGLNLGHFAELTGDPALDDAARRATRLVADRLGGVDDVAEVSGGSHPYAGLLRGSAGRALLFVRAYERTGEPELLDHAATALRQDLRRCVPQGAGRHLHVDEGWRTMPYLAQGSVGIGLVLHRYLAHRQDDDLVAAARDIRGAACAFFYVQSGLFTGRAGMVLYLADHASWADRPEGTLDPNLAAQIRRLDWHAVGFQDHLAFPGDRMLRLSMDLATGSAGVLLALGAALHDDPVHLPFLGDVPGRTTDDQTGRR